MVNAQKKANIELINSLSIKREDELIVISRKFLESKLGKIGINSFVELKVNGKAVPVQFDDLNRDGSWDEMALLYTFKPKEKVNIRAVQSAVKPLVYTQRAHARQRRKLADNSFGKDLLKDSVPAGQLPTDFAKEPLPPFLTEGPAWENDRVGFRIYFDKRNGIDIWGKTGSSMVLDSVGIDPRENYHEQAPWGMDVLKVGASLGAGSLALWVPSYQGSDTLVRLGGDNMGQIIYEKVADGPLRAMIRLHYPEWKALEGLKPLSITHEISIWGGKYFYESKVSAKFLPPSARLVTGIVNLKSKSFGDLHAFGNRILYSFDKQSENNDELGMAIVVREKDHPTFFKSLNSGTDIQNTYIASIDVKNSVPVSFRFYAGWSKSSPDFKDEKSFKRFLQSDSASFSSSIIIR